jgi:hypothetical protein
MQVALESVIPSPLPSLLVGDLSAVLGRAAAVAVSGSNDDDEESVVHNGRGRGDSVLLSFISTRVVEGRSRTLSFWNLSAILLRLVLLLVDTMLIPSDVCAVADVVAKAEDPLWRLTKSYY